MSMRKIFIVLLVSASSPLLAQKWSSEFGLNYVYAKPIGGMGRIIDRGNGIGFNLGAVNPHQRFTFGIDMSYVQYAREKTKQEYNLDDGTVAPMEIIVSNSFANFMGYARWYLTTKGMVRPFLVGKLGYSLFSTDLSVYDPDYKDHCEPVDDDVLYHDGTMIAGVGAGAKFDLRSVFKKLPAGRFYFESCFNFTQGGQVRYMNSDADKHMQSGMPDADPVMTQFINTQTQIIHEHHVGYLYTNPVQMFELQFGLSVHFLR
jgi:hypothetical protein